MYNTDSTDSRRWNEDKVKEREQMKIKSLKYSLRNPILPYNHGRVCVGVCTLLL